MNQLMEIPPFFRDRHGEQTVVEAAKEDIGLTPNVTKRGQPLLIIEGLENYNKV